MSVEPVICWAAVESVPGACWINPHTIRRLRSESRDAYLACWNPEDKEEALSRVRFVRVSIAPQAGTEGER